MEPENKTTDVNNLNIQYVKKIPFFFKILLIIMFIISITGIGASLYLYFNPVENYSEVEKEKIIYKSDTLLKTVQEAEEEKINEVQKSPADLSQLHITGWVPDWDIPDGLELMKVQKDSFDSISPVWFYVNEDGSLKPTAHTNDSEFINFCRNNGIELIPTISLFDHEIMSKVLRSEENTNRHIDEIVNQVTNNNYDGIDLDYESIRLADKELFLSLLENLSVKLEEKEKKFVVTVLAKWGETFPYNSLPETRHVQDYKRISESTDEFRIMTYEFTSPSSEKAGPIAPISWMELVIKYAISVGVPREKIVLGIHTYAYDWPTTNIMTSDEVKNMDIIFSTFYDADVEKAEALYYESVLKIRNEYNFTENFNEEWAESIGTYNFQGQDRTVIFIDNQGIVSRKNLAAEYGIMGVAYWRVGDEQNSIQY